ncbi:MAG TPA: hypothetical protein VGI64_17000 [Streptosporangiaceae bacterium]
MDWLDAWLNRQHGARRGLLTWLQTSMITVYGGTALWSFFSSGRLAADATFLKVVAVSVIAAIPLGGLGATVRRHAAIRSGRPEFSWRVTACVALTLAGVELTMLTREQPVRGPVALTSGLLLAGAAVLWIAGVRDRRRQARPADAHQASRPSDADA